MAEFVTSSGSCITQVCGDRTGERCTEVDLVAMVNVDPKAIETILVLRRVWSPEAQVLPGVGVL